MQVLLAESRGVLLLVALHVLKVDLGLGIRRALSLDAEGGLLDDRDVMGAVDGVLHHFLLSLAYEPRLALAWKQCLLV